MPPFNDVNFRGLEVDANARFMMPEEDRRPVYIAIGNSITHGAGQGGAGILPIPLLSGSKTTGRYTTLVLEVQKYPGRWLKTCRRLKQM